MRGPAGARKPPTAKAGKASRGRAATNQGPDDGKPSDLTSPLDEWASVQLSDRQVRQAARQARDAVAVRAAAPARAAAGSPKGTAAAKGKAKKPKAGMSVVASRKLAAKAARKGGKKRG
ncbi:MAG: hypothetical protein ACKOFK_06215 [Betaproteobacteria bacterium]